MKNDKTTAANTATARVLATTELLEAILLRVDDEIKSPYALIVTTASMELFPLRRVSKTWNAVINDSIALQRRMYLSPYLTPCAIIYEHQVDTGVVPTLWLMKLLTPHHDKLEACVDGGPDHWSILKAHASFHVGVGRDQEHNVVELPDFLYSQMAAHIEHLRCLGESFQRPDASWRSMRVSLSPQDNPNIQVRFRIFCTPHTVERLGQEWQFVRALTVVTVTGDTLGDIFDIYLELFRVMEALWLATKDPSVGLRKTRRAIQEARSQVNARCGTPSHEVDDGDTTTERGRRNSS